METHFPEVFAEYERLGRRLRAVLHARRRAPRSNAARWRPRPGHAAANSYWVSYSVTAADAANAPAGIATRTASGARCPAEAVPALAVADSSRPAGPALAP